MAFDTVLRGESMEADNVQQIIAALNGTSGGGQIIALTQLSDASNYALDVRNLDTTNGYGLRVKDASSNDILVCRKNNIVIGSSLTNDLVTFTARVSGELHIGSSTNNNEMTTGLTIDQSTADNEIICLRSSTDVAHVMTGETAAESFGTFTKAEAAAGGLQINGYKDAAGVAGAALVLNGKLGEAADETHSTAGRGVVEIVAQVTNGGTGLAALAANGNCLAVRNQTTTLLIIDAEGDIHCDAAGNYGNAVISGSTVAGYNTYDEFEDIELVRALEVERRGRGLVGHDFDRFLRYNRDDLERLKLAHFDEDGRPFVNYTGLVRLHSGALWQLWTRLQEMTERLALTEQRLSSLPSGEAS